MSGFITGFLNFTVGILCDKIRDVTARELSEGDLTDEKFRKLIIRELDDIKCRLDGLARKDLLSSFSFFKEGICRLNLCLHTSDYTSISKEDVVETKQKPESSTFNSKRDSFLDSALTLSNVIREMKFDSEERLLNAKKSLRTSREEATRAFNNVALTTDDRIMASKLRIASRILEGLQDPEAAAQDCLLYIEELHNMPAVREIFSVHVKGGMKSRLNQAKRLEKSRSITTLNFTLLEFISKFTKICIGVFNWPVIDLRGYTFHPIFDDDEHLVTVEKSGLNATWECIFSERLTIEGYHSCAVNSKGEIFITEGKWNRLASVKVVKRSGEIQLFSENVLEEKRLMYSVSSLTIDANDDVYLGICCLDTSSNGIRVLVFNSTGSIKRDLNLPIDEYFANDFCMNVTREKIITCSSGGQLHFFDKKNSELKDHYSLPHYNSLVECSWLSTSDENDIIVNYPRGESVNIYTERGELKQIIKLPRKDDITKELVHTVRGVVFDSIRQHVLVLIYDPFLFDQASYRLLVYSKSNELLNTFRLINFPVEGLVQLTSHPNGSIAVIGSRKAIFLHI
jgi:hypothetical protein